MKTYYSPFKGFNMPPSDEDSSSNTSRLKKIRGYIPAFQGYSSEDCTSDSDRMIRMAASQKIALARKDIASLKQTVEGGTFSSCLDQIEKIDNSLKRLASTIEYSGSGREWFSRTRWGSNDLQDSLYESDSLLIEELANLLRLTREIIGIASLKEVGVLERSLHEVLTKLTIIEEAVHARESMLQSLRP